MILEKITNGNSAGNFLTKWGTSGAGDGQFSAPSDVAVDSIGNVYVADTYNFRIQKFDIEGNFLDKWDMVHTQGYLVQPIKIAVDGSGNVFVTISPDIEPVYKFSSPGVLLTTFGTGTPTSPTGVAVNSEGNVYVTEPHNDQIEMWGVK
jgi:sugar lactone lactonase YvrE